MMIKIGNVWWLLVDFPDYYLWAVVETPDQHRVAVDTLLNATNMQVKH